MSINTDVLKRKQLRGDIVTKLYKDFNDPPLPVGTLILIMREDYSGADAEVPSQLRYLADPGKDFVRIIYKDGAEPDRTPMRSAFVQLTANGVNLAEGDVEDSGVIFGDAERA